MTFNEKMLENLVEFAFAEGTVHEHISKEEKEFLTVEDENGLMAVWEFDKKADLIALRGE